ncbi:MAG: SGNH/GDSL hydrolase family protein [Lachnospiraceae bacterium]|nr:SGNH/GDSL hydrolase family protein [Lachnospiraceae bacterium]
MGKLFCVLVSIACIGFLVYMNVNDRTRIQQKAEEVEAINEDTREAEKEIAQAEAEEKAAELAEKEANDSFYQKLADRFDARILVIGDTNAQGFGASSDETAWFSLLKKSIEDKYGVKVHVDNNSVIDSGAYASYAKVKMMEDSQDYDLVIICTGAADSEENLPVYYEALLRAIQGKIPNCNVITIQEYMEGDNNSKNMAILNLSNAYHAQTVDMYSKILTDPAPYVFEGGYLNDEGHRLYAEGVFSEIQRNVKSGTGFEPGPERTVYTDTEKFDDFLYVPAENFTRTDRQYAMERSFTGIVAFDFDVLPGDNKVDVYVDRVKVSSYVVTNTIETPVEHIELIEGELSPGRRIGVVFSTTESADSFRGMMLTMTE